tara:strand:- start:74 stop:430 length:357 start_codon:yes stop_codon:yes gene_type:complete
MAYKNTVKTQSNYDAEYWRLTEWTINRIRQGGEASAVFRLYRDKASAYAGASPVTEQVAKLRLSHDHFQEVFGSGRDQSKTDQELIYIAAADYGVNSDFGDMNETTKLKDLFTKAMKD